MAQINADLVTVNAHCAADSDANATVVSVLVLLLAPLSRHEFAVAIVVTGDAHQDFCWDSLRVCVLMSNRTPRTDQYAAVVHW